MASWFSRGEDERIDPKQRRKIKELAPENIAKAIVRSNPSEKQAGEIISELTDL